MTLVSRFQRLRQGSLVLSLIIFSASGCGPQGPETPVGSLPEEVAELPPQGTVARVGGQLRVLSSSEEQTLCRAQRCEPNLVYQEAMGRKRPKPPTEPEVPAPISDTPMPDDAVGEDHDYSKKVLRLYDAWQLTRGIPEVVVAVIDSGLDTSHPDLVENLWVNQAEARGVAGVDDDRNGYVDDVHGWDFVNDEPIRTGSTDHGTHVAGTVASAVNGIGTAGIAPGVRVMGLKFINSSGNGNLSDAVAAIEYAVKNGAHVINNSWGGSGFSSFLEEAIVEAISQGVFFVAASGNNGRNTDRKPFYPAGYNGVISVGSSDENDWLSSFSNYGEKSVEIAAPGSDIFSTLRNGRYGLNSGTSMAAPQVSGALALALSYRLDLADSEIRKAMCDSSIPLYPGTIRCGRLDMLGFLHKIAAK